MIPFTGYSQSGGIDYKNEFEQSVLTNHSSASDIELLLAISEGGSAQLVEQVSREIDQLFNDLEDKNIHSKSEEKQLKLIFKATHKSLFTKYQEVSNFNKIFESGIYNCVSATAIYSLILEKYQIPYQIKETPTPVYVLAYPGTKNIVLESTAPENGYFSPGSSAIQKAVKSLVDLKYYTQAEVDSMGVENVYMAFHFSEDAINIKQLAGLQYQNEGITFFNEEDYKKALNAIRKSALFYPSNRNELFQFVLLSKLLDGAQFEDYEEIQYLTDYANISKSEKKNVLFSYSNILNRKLYNQSKVQEMDSIFSLINLQLKDSTLLKSLAEMHYQAYSNFYGQKGEIRKALEFGHMAYALNPLDVSTQSLITTSVMRELSTRGATLSTIDHMKDYEKTYPFLAKNNMFQSLYFHVYSGVAYSHFRADDFKNGMYYLKIMEDVLAEYGENLQYDENLFGMVYAEAGAAYYRERKYWKAKQIIEKGLKIMPNHPELKVRLSIVMDELD